jgi:hypothetical protein
MEKENREVTREEAQNKETLVYKYGVKENVLKGLGIASILGVIGFSAYVGYSKLKELEKLKEEFEVRQK